MIGYPYLPNYQQQQQFMPTMQNNQVQQQNNNIIYVQGIEGAKSYLVGSNNTVILWDSDNPVIYIKSADATGRPNIKILDYTVRETESNQISFNDKKVEYATIEDIKCLESKIMALQSKLEKGEKDDE
ncbi:hypothetical protein [uncultured Eubacterium sp.]|uniref:hypothetical protein n=1 Tax=uncultured Eubacterium sp. TaxID=165185 RepID=UPI0025977538|nr:hypothetical protein [uncultured Eubacterium sp.]